MAKNQNNNVAPATQKTEPGAKKDALATALAQIEKLALENILVMSVMVVVLLLAHKIQYLVVF